MKVVINSEVAQSNGLTTEELLLILLVRSGTDIPGTLQKLADKQVLVKDLFNEYSVTQHWADVCDNVLLTSDSSVPSDEVLGPLAEKMMAIFPQCKKEGTSYFFKCNKREVVLKLKKFIKLYGVYPEEKILEATKKYVDSFNGDYTFMRLIKYFILKEDRKTNADGKTVVEETSTLATLLENEGALASQTFDIGELK